MARFAWVIGAWAGLQALPSPLLALEQGPAPRHQVADTLPSAAQPLPRPELVPAQVAVADILPSPLPPAATPGGLRDLRLLYPLATTALQIDPWGWRWSQTRRAWRMHTGVDLAADEGTPVLAARAGRVLLVESVGAYGLSVLMTHDLGLETLYAHLLDAAVTPGQLVEAGHVIGRVGASGQVTGPHLHFELRQRGSELRALDPTPHLPPLLPPPPAPAAVATIIP